MPFTCPRCHQPAEARFYGPCDSCRDDLRATLAADPREASGDTAFEPAMHVTPNHVATKD